MATLQLHGTSGLYVLLDDEDLERASLFKWYAHKSLHTHYATRHPPQRDGPEPTRLHRFVLDLPLWKPGDLVVDHVNGDGLDNRKVNLRLVTQAVNSANRHHGIALVRSCAFCDKSFRPGSQREDRRYCSRRCAALGNPPLITQRKLADIQCDWCLKVFRPRQAVQRFCSLSCRSMRTAANQRFTSAFE